MTAGSTGLLDRLRTAGIDPSDADEQRLNKSLLMFATGLASVASMLWLVIYWSLGPQLSSTLPFAFGSLRSGGFGKRLFIGILIGIAALLLQRLFVGLADVYRFDVRVAYLLPPLLIWALCWGWLAKKL